MTPDKFENYRESAHKLWVGRPLIEVRAMRRGFEHLDEMNAEQRRTLIEDLKALELYKAGVHCVSEEWDRIQQAFYRA